MCPLPYQPFVLLLFLYQGHTLVPKRHNCSEFQSRVKRVFAFCGSNQDGNVETGADTTTGLGRIMNDLLTCFYLHAG